MRAKFVDLIPSLLTVSLQYQSKKMHRNQNTHFRICRVFIERIVGSNVKTVQYQITVKPYQYLRADYSVIECITLCNYTVTTGCSKCRSFLCSVVVVYCNYGAFFLTGTVTSRVAVRKIAQEGKTSAFGGRSTYKVNRNMATYAAEGGGGRDSGQGGIRPCPPKCNLELGNYFSLFSPFGAGGNLMPILKPSPVGRETRDSGEKTLPGKQLVGLEPTTSNK